MGSSIDTHSAFENAIHKRPRLSESPFLVTSEVSPSMTTFRCFFSLKYLSHLVLLLMAVTCKAWTRTSLFVGKALKTKLILQQNDKSHQLKC